MSKLIFGCGYLGSRVAQRWVTAGEEVFVVTRTSARASELASAGLSPIVAQITDADTIPPLPAADTVLFAVGFDRSTDQTIEQIYVEGLSNVVSCLAEDVGRFVYISSTGVYGQTDGEWVDEDSTTEPSTAGGKACLQAEELLTASSIGSRAVVLRLAGIYGPGRVPRRASIVQGEPIPSAQDGYLNLIHVEDAARIVAATDELPLPGLFAVSDGHPVIRRSYFELIAEMLDAPTVNFAPPNAESGRGRRAASNKRVANQRLIEAIGLELQYPSFRQGLAQIFESG